MRDYINEILAPGEKILWEGRPDTKHLLSKFDIFYIPFVLLFIGMITLSYPKIANSPKNINETYLFVMFMSMYLVSFYLLVGRFFHKKKLRKDSYYFITDKRIVTIKGRKIDFSEIKKSLNVTVKGENKHNKMILFGPDIGINVHMLEILPIFKNHSENMPLVFFGLKDVEEVTTIVNNIKK